MLKYTKKLAAILFLSVIFQSNLITTALAEGTTDTTVINQNQSDNSDSTLTGSSVVTNEGTDELTSEMDYIINNDETLSNDEIKSRLNKILDDLALKTPEERKNYSYKITMSFRHGLGMISMLSTGSFEKKSDSYYVMNKLSAEDKAEEMRNLIEGYSSRFKEIGLDTSLIEKLKLSRTLSLEFKDDSALDKFIVETDLNTIDELKARDIGINIYSNNYIALLSPQVLSSLYSNGASGNVKCYIELLHDYNYKLYGADQDTTTHISNDYLDIKTYGFHFGVILKYEDEGRLKNIDSFDAPVLYAVDYTGFKDSILLSRMRSFDFREFEEDGTVYFDNTFRISSINQLQVSSLYSGPHAVGTFFKTFGDVKNHWSKDYVEELASRLLVNGKSYEYFEPDSNITRAEYAVLLSRILRISSENYNGDFKDVNSNDWFAENIQAASNYGLIKGDGGYFRPNDPITREEMTAILMRAFNLIYNETVTSNNDRFKDSADISLWASESIGGAVAKGFILGVAPDYFKPKSNATRAETATILMRFISYLENNK